jgi:hypothetical protein
MNTRTQPALTESASNGLRPPVDGNIIMGSVDPGTWARSKRATRWKTDEDVLLAIGGAACCGRASGDQHILKDERPVSKSQDAQEVAWGAGEIALGRPFSLLRRPCSQTDPSEDPLAVQSGFWMPS